LGLGDWSLFGIWDLDFGILIGGLEWKGGRSEAGKSFVYE
jgi:hypothetical protein